MTLSSADFELLLQANRILSSKLEVGDVLTAVMELATQIVRAEASSLLLLDEKTQELYFDVALGKASERVKEIRIKVGEGIAGWVAKERQPLIVNDVSQDVRFTGKVDQSTRFQTHSILAVPLVAKGNLIGVVEAINKENSAQFSSQDLEVFEMFASEAAIALENARLFSEVRRQKDKLDTVFSEMTEGVLSIDEDCRITLINKAATAVLGLKENKMVGQMFTSDLFPLFEIQPTFRNLSDIKEKSSMFEFYRKEVKELYLETQIHRLEQGEDKRHGGWLVILIDKTEERKEEKIKRNFLSLMSHKLKTPLTIILGYAPILQGALKGLSGMEEKAIRTIASQAEQLGNLVDKLLHFALVESDTIKSMPEPNQVRDLLEETIKQLKSMIEGKNVEVKMENIESGLPPIRVDSSLVIEVFKNLIENAIKFNDKEKRLVSLHAGIKGDTVWVQVSDNGRGIPPEEQKKVFQKFYQVENYFTGQVPGAGLGLAYCKKVVGAMGGAISLESQLGQGTTVLVSFPIAEAVSC